MEPEWRIIPGYSKYECSTNGDIRRTDTHRLRKPTLKVYWRIRISDGQNKMKLFGVHRLVALTFLPNPNGHPTVDHINRDKCNNRVSNLRWSSHKMQIANRDMSEAGHYCREVLQLDMVTGETIKEWSAMRLASTELKLHHADISNVCNGKKHETGGYRWIYKPQPLLDGEVFCQMNTTPGTMPIKGYFVSNCGRLMRPAGNITIGSLTDAGYRRVTVKDKRYLVHRLVAFSWLPPPLTDDHKYINHKDLDKAHNHMKNLEWSTSHENNLHSSIFHGKAREVEQYSLVGDLLATFICVADAAKNTGIKKGAINRNLQGVKKTCGEFIFKYNNSGETIEQFMETPRKIRVIARKRAPFKSVIQYDLNMNILRTFKHVSLAARETQIPIPTIYKHLKLRRQRPVHKKWFFKYE